MVLKADQERLKALLSETVLLLCKNGLEFKSDFCIEALIGITVDQDDVFLISIKETVENELRAAQRAKEEAEKLALEAAQSPAPESPSRTHRKRKRKSPRPQSPSQDKNIKLETSGDRELDNNTSNTSFQDYNDESQHSRNMKFESGGAGDMGGDDEDNSNEIVFVKTENTDDQSLYGGPGQSSFLDSPYQSGMDSSQMSSSFQSPGAHSSHPGTSSWQSPMDSSQQGMSQNPLETQQDSKMTDKMRTRMMSAARARAYRQRQLAFNKEGYLKTQREYQRKIARKKKLTLTEEEKVKIREMERIRKRMYRQKKKEKQVSSGEISDAGTVLTSCTKVSTTPQTSTPTRTPKQSTSTPHRRGRPRKTNTGSPANDDSWMSSVKSTPPVSDSPELNRTTRKRGRPRKANTGSLRNRNSRSTRKMDVELTSGEDPGVPLVENLESPLVHDSRPDIEEAGSHCEAEIKSQRQSDTGTSQTENIGSCQNEKIDSSRSEDIEVEKPYDLGDPVTEDIGPVVLKMECSAEDDGTI